jgi:chromosome segregation ATPase
LLGSSAAADSSAATSATVAKKIQDDEATIKKLEANLKVSESSMQMLITEVTRLSEAWEMLNASYQSKIFQLAQYADKLEQVKQERNKERMAKYQAERAKEEALRATNSQNIVIKKHKDAVEALKLELEALEHKIKSAEQEVTALTEYKVEHEKRIAVLDGELLKARKERDSAKDQLQAVSRPSHLRHQYQQRAPSLLRMLHCRS